MVLIEYHLDEILQIHLARLMQMLAVAKPFDIAIMLYLSFVVG